MFYTLIFVLFSFINSSYAQTNITKAMEFSVVKIFMSKLDLNYKYPWQVGESASGCVASGFVILHNGQKKIITNGHVAFATTIIEVAFPDNLAKTYSAKVDFLGDDSDLAMLSVADKEFTDKAVPLELSNDTIDIAGQNFVTVVGFPGSGNGGLCVTEGKINKIESSLYSQSNKKLPRIQTDAVINRGNSGGPVLDEKHEVVGVAFEYNLKYLNSFYVIPTIIVKQFLTDISDGKYDGVPGLNFYFNASNELVKKFLSAPDGCTGVCVSSTCEVLSNFDLKKGDLITKLNNYEVDDEGFIHLGSNVLSLSCAIASCQVGDAINIEIVRDGKKQTVCIGAARARSLLELNGKLSYYINGGIIFENLTENYVDNEGKEMTNLTNLSGSFISKDRAQVVFIPSILG